MTLGRKFLYSAGGLLVALVVIGLLLPATARGGLYRISLVDGIGQPANYNRFSDQGTSINHSILAWEEIARLGENF